MAERRFDQLKVPEFDSPRMIGAGSTAFRLTLTSAYTLIALWFDKVPGIASAFN